MDLTTASWMVVDLVDHLVVWTAELMVGYLVVWMAAQKVALKVV